MTNKINVLDKGYVRLVDTMGNDLTVSNSARVSFYKEVDVLTPKDEKLINFLWREKHTSPFRHAVMSFEVYAPLMVARQWWKHHVASTGVDDQNGWNESSRRYVTEEPEFYIPKEDAWRGKPANSKQGSNGTLPVKGRMSNGLEWVNGGQDFTRMLEHYIAFGEENYNIALQAGVAPEQARLFLPAYGMYVRWRWTTSLHGVLNFLNLRLPSDAQYEIREYAKVVESFVKQEFPATWNVITPS